MPVTASNVQVIHEYAKGVMDRADHHAGKVKGVALAILGGILWRADPGSIRIRQYAGNPANMLWAKVGGREYAFRYEHGTEQIEIRDGSQNGAVLHSFNDSTTLASVEAVFRSL